MSSAYLLVSHGSRDPRPQAAAQYLAQLLLQQLESSSPRPTRREAKAILSKKCLPIAGTATLELAPIPLHQSIQEFALRAKAAGFAEVQIVPLFLHEGVHVLEDIPTEVERARQGLREKIALHLQPHVGSSAAIKPLLEAQFEHLAAPRRILLSHGSRRPGGNDGVAAIASQLNALPAYWSVAPSLAEQVSALGAGESIAIVPYFLFAGGITEALAADVERLQRQFPRTPLLLGQPLGASSELAELIVETLLG